MENSVDSSSEELHSLEEDEFNITFRYNDPLLFTGIMKDVLLNDKQEVLRKISLGKSVRVVDNNGKSLLHFAVQAARDDMSMIDLLLQQDETDINAADFTTGTPLTDSIVMKKSSVAIYLIKAGANVNVPVDRTPLHRCIENGLSDVCEALIQAGADLNAQDFDCDTPLHLAIYYNQFEIMCMLLCYGADVDPNTCLRPLTFSLSMGRFGYADILLDYETEFQASCLEYALKYKYPNLELLLSKIAKEKKNFCFSLSHCWFHLLSNVNAFEFIWKNFQIEDDLITFFHRLFSHKFSNTGDFIRIVDVLKNSKKKIDDEIGGILVEKGSFNWINSESSRFRCGHL